MKVSSFLTHAFLGLAVPALIFGALETAARIFSSADSEKQTIVLDMPRWLVNGRSNPEEVQASELRWFKFFESGEGFRVRLQKSESFVFPDTFSWSRHLPGAEFRVQSNEKGFRRSSSPLNAPRRIQLFGDSSSFGWGVSDGEHYAHVLEARTGNKTRIENFAMPGDSSAFGSLVVKKFLGKAPSVDAVIFSFGANDARRSAALHSSLVENYAAAAPFVQELNRRIMKHSHFYRGLHSLLSPKKPEAPVQSVIAVPVEEYKKNLRGFAKLARARGIEDITLLSICNPGHYSRAMAKVAKNLGLRYVNGQAALKKKLEAVASGELYPELKAKLEQRMPALLKSNHLAYVSTDGCHPNAIGHQIISDELEKELSAPLPAPRQKRAKRAAA